MLLCMVAEKSSHPMKKLLVLSASPFATSSRQASHSPSSHSPSFAKGCLTSSQEAMEAVEQVILSERDHPDYMLKC